MTSETGPGRGAARTGRQPSGFLLTVLIGCLNNAPLMSARLILPMIAMSMGASPSFVGIIASLFTAVPIAFNVAFGRWVDRSGTLLPMILASSIIGFASLLPLIYDRPATLLVAAGLIGAGTVFAHVVATRAVGEIGGPEQRTRNLGLLIAAYSVFQFIGPMMAGAALEHYGSGWAFASLGSFSMLALLCLAMPWHRYVRWTTVADVAKARPRIRELLDIGVLVRWLTVGGVMSSVVTIFPFIVALQALEIGMSASEAGLALGAFAIGNVVSRALAGVVSRRVSVRVAISWMLGVGALVYAALPFMPDFMPFAALSGLLGLVLGMAVPFVLSMIYAASPPGRVNEAIGLSMMLTNTLQTILPLGLGVLAARLGGSAMAWVLTFLMLVALPLTLKK